MPIETSATSEAVLYTLAPSHYCERARWALDRRGFAYAETRLALGPHAVRLRRMGLPDTALPLLCLADGALVQGSGRILDLCGFPSDDPALEARFETRVGTLVRRFVYAAAFASPGDGGIAERLLDGVAAPEREAGFAAWPEMRPRLVAGFGATPEALPEITAALEVELDWCDALVAEGTLGKKCDRLSITAASLLSPLARPPEGPVRRQLEFSAGPAAFLHGWTARPTLVWVRGLYSRCRTGVVEDGTAEEPAQGRSDVFADPVTDLAPR